MAEDKLLEKDKFDGSKVSILGETYEAGSPEKAYNWRDNLSSREEKIKYLKNGERYWYSEEGYGSEKRKNPA
jgi:hypothetical protein